MGAGFFGFFGRRRRERELDEELRSHFDMAVAERVASGESREVAERAVRREFGNEARVREVTRTMWGGVWLDRVLQDVRFGLRSLARDRGFAVVAALTLGLGIGVTTAMFTVVNGVLFRPLPFAEPERLVMVGVHDSGEAVDELRVVDVQFGDIDRASTSFDAVATYMTYPPTTLTGAGEPARMTAAFVTSGLLDVLGVQPAFGRGLTPADDQAGAARVVVLGDALWRQRFGSDRDILGSTVTLDGLLRTVVGVMPPGFDFPERADLWLPLQAHPFLEEGPTFANPVVARLRDGPTREQAAAELSALGVAAGWQARSGDAAPVARVIPLREAVVGDSRYPLRLFTAAVALVLLISCVNVANLLLMRAGMREQEIGLRKALGAGRPRLVRQLLTESVMLAMIGGALGVGVGTVGVRALLALAPAGAIPRGQELGVDLAALAFTVVVSVATGVVFGLAPAFRASRRELRDTITQGARTHTRRRGLARGALVMAEVGLAVILLTGAGLLLRSFQQIRQVDLGFEPREALTAFIDLPEDAYADTATAMALHRTILDGLARIPTVEEAGAGNFEPFGPISRSTRVASEDDPEQRVSVPWMVASPGYLRAMGIPLLSGRSFTEQDDASSEAVVVVSRSLAERLWPDRDPVGERLTSGRNEWLTVVGVAEDVVQYDVTAEKAPFMYLPLAQVDDVRDLRHMSYVARTGGGASVAPPMRAVLRDADPDIPVGAVTSMDEVVLESLSDRVFEARVLGTFAFLAVLLAAVGVYGAAAYSVSERTREFGIRMAMGARADQIAGATVGQVVRLVGPGLVLGVVAAGAATRLIEASLYEVAPGDPATLVGVTLVLGMSATVAALAPARRATKIDPIEVLSE